MFNEKRIEDIRNKIQASKLMADHEKSDWLNLLELMNDKQLGELEEILAVTENVSHSVNQVVQNLQTSQPTQSKPVTPPQSIPALNHLANIPTDLNMTHSVPPSVAKTMPAAVVPSPAKVAIDKLSPKPASVPSRPASIPNSQPTPAPASQPVQSAPPSQPSQPSNKQMSIQTIAELQQVAPETLREFDLQSVVNAILGATQHYGYFRVLQILESSPLYKAYIDSGKAMLNKEKSSLTQSEFEFITDLLRHMRFNQQ